MEHGTFVVFELFNFVSVAEKHEEQTFHTERRFHHVRDVALVLDRVNVFLLDLGFVLVLRQVVVRTACDTPEFAPTEREFVFDVGGTVGVVRKFFLGMFAEAELFLVHAEVVHEPVEAVLAPEVVPVKFGARFAEEFEFHLFEFAGTEDEVTRSDFVTERLTDLTDTERDARADIIDNVLEVNEDTLSRFRTEVNLVAFAFDDADFGLEHQVECAGLGPIGLAACGAFNLVVHHHLVDFVKILTGAAAFAEFVFQELVSAETFVAGQAVHQRVREVTHVARSLPHAGVQKNGAVETQHILTAGHELLPPEVLNVALEFHAIRTVVPSVGEAIVNFGARKNESAALAEGDDVLEGILDFLCHFISFIG